jgi:ABC-type multidrug transport system ATPase subunit
MKNKLICDGVQLEFDLARILSNVYLTCETGQIVGLLGRNGSGKSSLLKIIFGSLQCSSKSVRINEERILGRFSRDISYLPQESFIPPFLQIKEAFNLYKISLDGLVQIFPEFADHLNLRAAQLSGGMLRIAELFLIINLPSKFCLLDEPFSGIMPVHIEKLRGYFKEMKNKKGFIITDHIYRSVLQVSDVIYVLRNGQTYEISNAGQLVEHGYVNTL